MGGQNGYFAWNPSGQCCTCPCDCGFCTTRLYDPNGIQQWVYDHGAETYACAAGAGVYYVGGQRDSDITLTGSGGTWTIARGATVSGGAFRLAVDTAGLFAPDDFRTGQLAVNCSAADVQSALAGLANVGSYTITASGGPLDAAPIVVSVTGAPFEMRIRTQEVTGPATIRKLDASGNLVASAGTKMPVKDMVVMGGNLYVLTDSSGCYTEPIGDTETGVQTNARIGCAVGEVSGGTFKLVWRGQGIITSAQYLVGSTDLNWNCTASDVQSALTTLIPDPGITVSSSGGPLPDAPIYFGVSGYTLGDPHFLGVLQGNVTGPVSIYKFDADLNLLATGHSGANFNHVIVTDGTALYIGHSGEGKVMWYGYAESTSTGDITFRKFSDTLSPQTVGIATGAWVQGGAVQSSGILVNGAGKDRMYKLVGGGVGMTFTIDGVTTPGVGGTASAADINAVLAGSTLGAAGGPLPTYPVYIIDSKLEQFPFVAHPTYSVVSVSAGTLTILVNETDGGALRLYDSSGAYITTEQYAYRPDLGGTGNAFPTAPRGWHGITTAPGGRWVAHIEAGIALPIDVTQFETDLSAKIWTFTMPGTGTGDPIIDAMGFDSLGQFRLSGNPPGGGDGQSTHAYDNSSPPNQVWSRRHGFGDHSGDPGYWNLDANLYGLELGSIYDQDIDGSDNVLVTGTRVDRSKFP